MAAGVGLLDYCATGNLAVEGWLHEEALLLTLALHRQQRAAGIAGGVAEIGVYHGRFFLALALCCGGDERALAVDLFDRLRPGREAAVRGDRDVFAAHLETWGVAGRTAVRQDDSLTLTPEAVRGAVGAAGARLFSVDGAHSFGHAIADLRLAASSLAPGGVVLLDDFLHAEWLGVTEAAVALLREPSPPLAPLAICGGKLALCAPADHAAWMERLGGCLLPYAREAERVLFCGVECWRFWLRSGEGAWALWGAKPVARLDIGGPVPLGGTLGEGWSFPETWGRWTVAGRADCAVLLPPPGSRSRAGWRSTWAPCWRGPAGKSGTSASRSARPARCRRWCCGTSRWAGTCSTCRPCRRSGGCCRSPSSAANWSRPPRSGAGTTSGPWA
jgi:hypothetical protein